MFARINRSVLSLIALAVAFLTIQAVPITAFAGNATGPTSRYDSVLAYDYDDWTAKFVGGRYATVTIDGDGDTDLDLYVYDSYGNLVAADDDYLDYCIAEWIPSRTQTYTIRIVNRGSVYNSYKISTN
jgi:hypothetical protein